MLALCTSLKTTAPNLVPPQRGTNAGPRRSSSARPRGGSAERRGQRDGTKLGESSIQEAACIPALRNALKQFTLQTLKVQTSAATAVPRLTRPWWSAAGGGGSGAGGSSGRTLVGWFRQTARLAVLSSRSFSSTTNWRGVSASLADYSFPQQLGDRNLS